MAARIWRPKPKSAIVAVTLSRVGDTTTIIETAIGRAGRRRAGPLTSAVSSSYHSNQDLSGYPVLRPSRTPIGRRIPRPGRRCMARRCGDECQNGSNARLRISTTRAGCGAPICAVKRLRTRARQLQLIGTPRGPAGPRGRCSCDVRGAHRLTTISSASTQSRHWPPLVSGAR